MVPIPTVSTRHAVVRVVDATGAAAGSVQASKLGSGWKTLQVCLNHLVSSESRQMGSCWSMLWQHPRFAKMLSRAVVRRQYSIPIAQSFAG